MRHFAELPLDVVLSHTLGLRLNMARRVSYSSKAVELATLSSPKTDDRRPVPGTGAQLQALQQR